MRIEMERKRMNTRVKKKRYVYFLLFRIILLLIVQNLLRITLLIGFGRMEGKDLADRNSCYRKSPKTNALTNRYSFRGALAISVIKSGLICAPSIRGVLFVCFTRHWQMFGKSDTENSYIDQESDFESSCREYIFPNERFSKFFFFIHSDFHTGK